MKSTALNRRQLVLSIPFALAVPRSATAQVPYPNKPIRFVVPFPPGGNSDPVARMVGQKLEESWGQPVIVDNRPGGNTIIGNTYVAKSPPDGYTLETVFASFVILPSLYETLPYDPIKDFTPVGTWTVNEQLLVVPTSLPVNTLQEFIALAKSKPGKLNYGTTAAGGITHVSTEMFCLAAGIKLQHVPYKGGGPATVAVVGGEVEMFLSPPLIAIPMIKAGRLKPIAISGERRLPALPDVPTFAQAGLPGLNIPVWFGVVAPAGTPKPVIDKLSAEFTRIMALPDVKEKLFELGQEPFVTTPDQFGALLKSDLVRYGKVVKAANIKID
jgi:tripartite-type tricarboxylate transporter receptor subunit TctC